MVDVNNNNNKRVSVMSLDEDTSDEELDLLSCSGDDDDEIPVPFLAPLMNRHFHLQLEQGNRKESDEGNDRTSLKRRRSESPEMPKVDISRDLVSPEESSLFKMQLDQLLEVNPCAQPPAITTFLLREYLKISSGVFRPRQAEVCFSGLQGKSTLAICPTGWGKSLCYLFPMLVHRLRYEEALNLWVKTKANDENKSVEHVPNHIYTKFCVVVSPLISLMSDQASKIIDAKALSCVVFSSQTGRQREQRILDDLAQPRSSVDIVFISPEKLIGCGRLREIITTQAHRLAFLCIDEVHCVSKWAFNFRPSYMCLHRLVDWTAKAGVQSSDIKVKYLCLTATASKKVIQDLQSSFQIEYTVQCCDQYRKNLLLESCALVDHQNVSPPTTRVIHDALIRAVQELPKPMLVYVRSRTDADELSSVLGAKLDHHHHAERAKKRTDKMEEEVKISPNMKSTEPPKELFVRKKTIRVGDHQKKGGIINEAGSSFIVRSYHAALSRELRNRIQQQFINDEIDVLVATVAFGMGIDKSNIRSVVHAHAPSSVENYVQEIGRAGRDGGTSFCRILYNPYDYFFLRSSILSSYLSHPEVDRMIRMMLRSPCTTVGEALILIPVESIAVELQMAEEIVETVLYRLVLSFTSAFKGIRGHCPLGYKVSLLHHDVEESSSKLPPKHSESSTGLALVLQQVAAQDAVFDLCKKNSTINHLIVTANNLKLSLDDLLFRLNDLEKCKVISLSRISKCFVVSITDRSVLVELANKTEKRRSLIDIIHKDQESQLFSQTEGLAGMFAVLQHPSHKKIDLVMRGQSSEIDLQEITAWKPPVRSLSKVHGVTIVNEFIESNRMRIRSKYEVVRALLGIIPKSAIKTGKYAGLVPLEYSWYTQSPYFGALREFDFKWVLTVVSASDLPD